MIPADYARVARAAMSLGTVNFSFQGGEPLLCKDLEKVIKAVRPSLNIISVTTNGTLLTPKRIQELKAWGVDILTVSLDSGIPEEHDRFRGIQGSFSSTVSGIEDALQAGLRVTIGAVVTHTNIAGLGMKALMDFAEKRRLMLYLILPVPAGRWQKKHHEIALTPDDLALLDTYTARSSLIRTDFQANLGGRGCGAVKEILYLTPYGDVLACPFLHISLGNIFDEPLATIRSRARSNRWFATYHQKCLASTDEAFLRDHLSKTFTDKQLPLPWQSVF